MKVDYTKLKLALVDHDACDEEHEAFQPELDCVVEVPTQHGSDAPQESHRVGWPIP